MGYRSQVAFAIHPDKVSDFLAVLSGSSEAYDLCRYNDGIKTDMFEKGDLFVAMNGIKWYEGYKGVDTIDKFVADTIDEDDGPDKVRFLRVGEDREDIVECGDYAWDDLRVIPASIDWTVTKLK